MLYKKIAIVCAGDKEVKPFLSAISNPMLTEKAMLRFHQGAVEGVQVVALFCGVCKVNAAIATQILIDTYHVDAIINAGTAGGMDPKLAIFDTVITTESVYYDVDADILTEFHPWMSSVYFKSDENLLRLARQAISNQRIHRHAYFGRTVTGEKFIADSQRDDINARYAPLSVDMETASIAHVCHVNEKPFIAVRTITDTADHSGLQYFEQNCQKASAISKEMVIALLKQINTFNSAAGSEGSVSN